MRYEVSQDKKTLSCGVGQRRTHDFAGVHTAQVDRWMKVRSENAEGGKGHHSTKINRLLWAMETSNCEDCGIVLHWMFLCLITNRNMQHHASFQPASSARFRQTSASCRCLSSSSSSSAILDTLLCRKLRDVMVLRMRAADFLSLLATKWNVFWTLPPWAGGECEAEGEQRFLPCPRSLLESMPGAGEMSSPRLAPGVIASVVVGGDSSFGGTPVAACAFANPVTSVHFCSAAWARSKTSSGTE